MIDDPLPHLRLLARTVPAADAAGIALLRAQAEIATLRAENAELIAEIAQLRATIADREATIAMMGWKIAWEWRS